MHGRLKFRHRLILLAEWTMHTLRWPVTYFYDPTSDRIRVFTRTRYAARDLPVT